MAEARQTAPRVVVVLTKVDLLTDAERTEVTAFLDGALREASAPPSRCCRSLATSSRSDGSGNCGRASSCRWPGRGRGTAGGTGLEAGRAHRRLSRLPGGRPPGGRAGRREPGPAPGSRAGRVGQGGGDPRRIAACQTARVRGDRAAFEKRFFAERTKVRQRLSSALAAELRTWRGNLAQQAQRYEDWMAERLAAELTPLARDAAPLAADLLGQAEARFRRIVEAFRDRLSRNIQEATGVTVSPAAWEVKRPRAAAIPVAVSRAFMTNWELLWWLLPMRLVGGPFRRHVLGRLPWEVEKNLSRLAGDWAAAVDAAAADLQMQAAAWVDAELATLDRLLAGRPSEATAFRRGPPAAGRNRRVPRGISRVYLVGLHPQPPLRRAVRSSGPEIGRPFGDVQAAQRRPRVPEVPVRVRPVCQDAIPEALRLLDGRRQRSGARMSCPRVSPSRRASPGSPPSLQ